MRPGLRYVTVRLGPHSFPSSHSTSTFLALLFQCPMPDQQKANEMDIAETMAIHAECHPSPRIARSRAENESRRGARKASNHTIFIADKLAAERRRDEGMETTVEPKNKRGPVVNGPATKQNDRRIQHADTRRHTNAHKSTKVKTHKHTDKHKKVKATAVQLVSGHHISSARDARPTRSTSDAIASRTAAVSHVSRRYKPFLTASLFCW